MDEQLLTQARASILKSVGWLRAHEKEIASMDDFSAHYKAPYLWAAVGDPVKARYYADLMRDRYLQPDGDFRTSPAEKGYRHLPCSPANRYVYPNGWVIVGLRKMGYYGLARRGMEFVRRFQSPEWGGFCSRYEAATGRIDPEYMDSSSTSSAGLALLSCGHIEDARRAGDFLLRLLAAQPDPRRYYYSSWRAGVGLMTDVGTDEDQNSVRGRKQFCLNAEADALGELTWLIGKPMKFLAKLYDQTGEKQYLNGSIHLFDFFPRLGEGKWKNLASCKVMWAGSELYRHTGEKRFAETAERLLREFFELQDASGAFLHSLWHERVEDQPLALNLDNVQELCAEMTDTILDLQGEPVPESAPGALLSACHT